MNPFSIQTIRFDLPRQAEITLRVFNLLGAEVVTLIREKIAAGTHTRRWDGRNAARLLVRSGIYVLKLEAGNEAAVRKMAVVR